MCGRLHPRPKSKPHPRLEAIVNALGEEYARHTLWKRDIPGFAVYWRISGLNYGARSFPCTKDLETEAEALTAIERHLGIGGNDAA